MNTITHAIEDQGLLIIDGGLATELERRGADLNHELWSARLLIEDPGLIRDAHLDFLRAGADVIVTASYQASLQGFERAGLERAAAVDAMRTSVELARQARETFLASNEAQGRAAPFIAASIGPYGACLMDGSEYTGNYPLSKRELIDFHRPRMEILAQASPDLFAIETIPSQLEAEALLELLSEFSPMPAWLSFSCRDSARVSHGEPFVEGAGLADAHSQVVAVGVNCSDPAFVKGLLLSAGDVDKPLLAYPNSGEAWCAATNTWHGEANQEADPREWYAAGARLIGGCCRVSPEQISSMRGALLEYVGR